MTKDEALKLALEALEPFSTPNWAGAGVDKANEAIAAIREALAQLAPLPVQRQPLTDEQRKILNFLYGAGEWDGNWFGEPHPTKSGAFWWRTDLRRLFDDAPETAHNIGAKK
jgi:hypothetical protein